MSAYQKYPLLNNHKGQDCVSWTAELAAAEYSEPLVNIKPYALCMTAAFYITHYSERNTRNIHGSDKRKREKLYTQQDKGQEPSKGELQNASKG